MASEDIETCGRCTMSTVVDAVSDDADPDRIRRTVYGSTFIEVDESDLLRVSPHLRFVRRLQTRLDRLGFELIYGR